ncbi:unnamed protein product [Sphagnum balticum]
MSLVVPFETGLDLGRGVNTNALLLPPDGRGAQTLSFPSAFDEQTLTKDYTDRHLSKIIATVIKNENDYLTTEREIISVSGGCFFASASVQLSNFKQKQVSSTSVRGTVMAFFSEREEHFKNAKPVFSEAAQTIIRQDPTGKLFRDHYGDCYVSKVILGKAFMGDLVVSNVSSNSREDTCLEIAARCSYGGFSVQGEYSHATAADMRNLTMNILVTINIEVALLPYRRAIASIDDSMQSFLLREVSCLDFVNRILADAGAQPTPFTRQQEFQNRVYDAQRVLRNYLVGIADNQNPNPIAFQARQILQELREALHVAHINLESDGQLLIAKQSARGLNYVAVCARPAGACRPETAQEFRLNLGFGNRNLGKDLSGVLRCPGICGHSVTVSKIEFRQCEYDICITPLPLSTAPVAAQPNVQHRIVRDPSPLVSYASNLDFGLWVDGVKSNPPSLLVKFSVRP